MALEIWCSQDQLPTADSGTTDLAHASVTTVPVAALHFHTTKTSNGPSWSPARMCIGATDGTTQAYSAIASENNVATTDCNKRNGNNACIGETTNSSAAVQGLASHNSFIAGGQRINNDDGFGAARLCNSMFFAGCTAGLEVATLNGTNTINVDPGFAWKAVIFFGCPHIENDGATNTEIFFGFFDRTNQGGLSFKSAHGQPILSDLGLQISDTYVGGELAGLGGSIDYGIAAAVGSGTSLDLTPSDSGGDTDAVRCLFLGWSSSETVAVVPWQSPTSTGNQALTGFGFEPMALLNIFTQADEYDVAEAAAQAGTFSFGMETADDQFVASYQEEYDTGVITRTQSYPHNQSVHFEDDDWSSGHIAAFVSFDEDGVTRDWTTTKGTAYRQLSLAFSAYDVNDHVILVPKGPRRNRAV